jgi:hypothetical protein
MEITLRSGVQIVTDVEEFTVTKSRITAELQELHWTTPAGALRRLKHANLSDIVAIVAVHEPDDSEDELAAALEGGTDGRALRQ